MANRHPLVVEASGVSSILELPSGDNLDLTGSGLVTSSNSNIELDPDGSGAVVFKGNATKGAGQFKLNCENNSHGITIKGPPHSAAANYTLTLPTTDGNADQVLKSDGSGNTSWGDAAAGGRWTQIATTTIGASEVFSVEFTSLGSYDEYELRFAGVESGSNPGSLYVHFDYGSGYPTSGMRFKQSRFANGSGAYNSTVSENVTNAPGAVNLSYGNIIGNTGTRRAPGFGVVTWSKFGSLFSATYFGNTSSTVGYIQRLDTVGANLSYEQVKPTKVKLMSLNSGSETTNGGFSAGKITLYGLSTS